MADLSHPLRETPHMALQRQQAEQVDAITAAIGKRLERASGYTKAVVAIGYGAIFGIWGFSKDLMPPKAQATVALLMILSAGVFVLWEVYSHLTSANDFNDLANRLNQDPASAIRAIQAYDDDLRRTDVRRAPIWRMVVFVTLLSALAAAAITVYFAAGALVGPLFGR
jgi:hypothetical protein